MCFSFLCIVSYHFNIFSIIFNTCFKTWLSLSYSFSQSFWQDGRAGATMLRTVVAAVRTVKAAGAVIGATGATIMVRPVIGTVVATMRIPGGNGGLVFVRPVEIWEIRDRPVRNPLVILHLLLPGQRPGWSQRGHQIRPVPARASHPQPGWGERTVTASPKIFWTGLMMWMPSGQRETATTKLHKDIIKTS